MSDLEKDQILKNLLLSRKLLSRSELDGLLQDSKNKPGKTLGQILLQKQAVSVTVLTSLMKEVSQIQQKNAEKQRAENDQAIPETRADLDMSNVLVRRLEVGNSPISTADLGRIDVPREKAVFSGKPDSPGQIAPQDRRDSPGKNDSEILFDSSEKADFQDKVPDSAEKTSFSKKGDSQEKNKTKQEKCGSEAAEAEQRGTTSSSPTRQRIGHYEILQELGRGGMGVVYLARQESLKRLVALKLLIGEGLSSEVQIKRFQREAEVMASISHPNIVKIYDVGEFEGKPYIAMEYIAGRSLSKIMAENRTPLRSLIEMAWEVAQALQLAHTKGIVHRDIKPDNILVDSANHPHVTDFGLAQKLDSESRLTVSGSALGTPFYMPPEQALGKRSQMDHRADIYALGVVLYEMTTKSLPFKAETLGELFHKILYKDPVQPRKLNPVIHPDIETVIGKAMEKEPGRRYATCKDLAEDLRRYLDGEPIKAKPPDVLTVAIRKAKKNPIASSMAAVMILCLALFLIYWWWMPGMLTLDTSPSGAEVYIENRKIGSTPLKDVSLPAGVYHIHFQKQGFLPNVAGLSELMIRRGEHKNILIPLISARGILQIVTEPPGADVQVFSDKGNMVHQGFSPLVAELSEGYYDLKIARDNYLPEQIKRVQVNYGHNMTRRDVNLVKNTGMLRIFSQPPEVSVEVRRIPSGGKGEKRTIGTFAAPFVQPLELEAGSYELFSTKENYESRLINVEIECGQKLTRHIALPPLLVWECHHSENLWMMPLVGDLYGRGFQSVIVADRNKILAFSYFGTLEWEYRLPKNFEEIENSPLQYVGEAETNSNMCVVADMDMDGCDDIVAALDKIVCLNGKTGKPLWISDLVCEYGPVLGDVNGDGLLEIVIMTKKGGYVLSSLDGQIVERFMFDRSNFPNMPALADFDLDGVQDILFCCGTDLTCLSLFKKKILWKKELKNLKDKKNGSEAEDSKTNTSVRYSGVHPGDMCLGDMNGDGVLDAVMGTSDGEIFAWDGKNGNLLWQVKGEYAFDSAPAIGDINGDGKMEVIINGPDITFAIDNRGKTLWSRHRYPTVRKGDMIVRLSKDAVVLCDVNSDGQPEVLTTGMKLYCLRGRDGQPLWEYSLSTFPIFPPAVSDMDGNGQPEILLIQGKSVACIHPPGSDLFAYVPAMHNTTMPSASLYDWNNDGKKDLILVGFHLQGYNALDGELLFQLSQEGDSKLLDFVLGDLEKDGKNEIVVSLSDYTVRVYSGQDLKERWRYRGNYCLWLASKTADINGDGVDDIVAIDQVSGMLVLSGKDGKLLAISEISAVLTPISPTLAYAGKGNWMVVYADQNHDLYGVDAKNGQKIWKQRYIQRLPEGYIDEITHYSSALALDVNEDGQEEIIVGTPNQHLYCLDIMTGKPLWEQESDRTYDRSISAEDVDGDGKPEILTSCPSNVYVNLIRSYGMFRFIIPNRFHVTVVGGMKECMLHTYTMKPYNVEVRSARTGQLAWRRNLENRSQGIALAGDYDGDGCKDVAAGDTIFRGKDGAILGQLSSFGERHTDEVFFSGTLVFWDFDGDGKEELALCAKKIQILKGFLHPQKDFSLSKAFKRISPAIKTLEAVPSPALWSGYGANASGTRNYHELAQETLKKTIFRYLVFLETTEEYQKLQAQLDILKRTFPQWYELRILEGRTFFNQKKYTEAQAIFSQIWKERPLPMALVWRARCFMETGKIPEALEDLNLACKKYACLDQGFLYRGIAYFQQKKYVEAEKDFLLASQINTLDMLPLYYLTQIYDKSGDVKKWWIYVRKAYHIQEGYHLEIWQKINHFLQQEAFEKFGIKKKEAKKEN